MEFYKKEKKHTVLGMGVNNDVVMMIVDDFGHHFSIF